MKRWLVSWNSWVIIDMDICSAWWWHLIKYLRRLHVNNSICNLFCQLDWLLLIIPEAKLVNCKVLVLSDSLVSVTFCHIWLQNFQFLEVSRGLVIIIVDSKCEKLFHYTNGDVEKLSQLVNQKRRVVVSDLRQLYSFSRNSYGEEDLWAIKCWRAMLSRVVAVGWSIW